MRRKTYWKFLNGANDKNHEVGFAASEDNREGEKDSGGHTSAERKTSGGFPAGTPPYSL